MANTRDLQTVATDRAFTSYNRPLRFMGTCKMLITLFLCLDGWVVGWVVFHHFQVCFTIFMFCFY